MSRVVRELFFKHTEAELFKRLKKSDFLRILFDAIVDFSNVHSEILSIVRPIC